MDNTDSYVVWDVPGQPGSVLVNLDLIDALKRLFLSKPRREHKAFFGILLGRSSRTNSNRTLVTIEDCTVVTGDLARLPEDTGGLSRVGLVRGDEGSAGDQDVLVLVRRVPKGVPVASLVWRGEHTDVPLDSARLKAGGFTILQGAVTAREPVRKQRAKWRKWAWVPLAASIAVYALVSFWPEHEYEEPVPAEIAARPPSTPAPAVSPKPQDAPLPKAKAKALPPPVRRMRAFPPTVTVGFRPAPESAVRRIVNGVPALPLLRRFQVKNDDDFVSPNPIQEAKPEVPPDVARKFPGEWRVELRLAIDKSGQVSHISLLGSGANPQFVSLARAAASRWAFEPALLHDRPVSSGLDVTFQFRNPVVTEPRP